MAHKKLTLDDVLLKLQTSSTLNKVDNVDKVTGGLAAKVFSGCHGN